jgi:superfamily II DNA or RNA helicase
MTDREYKLLKERERLLNDIASKPYLNELWEHQQEDYIKIGLEFAKGHTGVALAAVTGYGKSRLGRSLVRAAYEKLVTAYPDDMRKKILWLGENDHIIKNALEHLTQAGIPSSDLGVIKAYRSKSEYKFEPQKRVQIASIQTLNASWQDWERRGLMPVFDFKLIVVDEFHHYHNKSERYKPISQRYPTVKKLGLSATPESKYGFTDNFTSLIVSKTQKELAMMGYQPHWKCFGVPVPDGIDRKAMAVGADGEFTKKAAKEASDALKKGDIIKSWKNHVGDHYGRVPTILFAESVAKSKEYTDYINESGLVIDGQQVRAVHIDGTMPAYKVAEALTKFANGEATYLVNCAKVTEGFDLATVAQSLGIPLASVGCIQDLSFSNSIKRHKQKVGRARGIMIDGILTAFYIDHVGACDDDNHGYPDTTYEWNLEGNAKRKKGQPGGKLCPPENRGCGRYIDRFLMICPYCGYDRFPKKLEPELEPDDHDINAELVELEQNALTYFTIMKRNEHIPGSGWAIGEFVKYSPTYKEMLEAHKIADLECDLALGMWIKGQRILKADWQWLPSFDEILEVFSTLAEVSDQKAWKKAKGVKPLHTYKRWCGIMEESYGRSWKPSMEELVKIQNASGFNNHWAWRESQQLVATRR